MTRLHAETSDSMHALLAPSVAGTLPLPLPLELSETAMAVSTGLLPPVQLWALVKVRRCWHGKRGDAAAFSTTSV
jgi:hypothetical protein